MSLLGQTRKSAPAILTSVLPSTADIRQRGGHVRKAPEAAIAIVFPHRPAASYVTSQGAYEGSIPFARSSYFSAIKGQRRSESRRPGPGRPQDVPVAHR